MLMWIGIAVCIIGFMWWLNQPKSEAKTSAPIAEDGKLDEHATIKRLIAQASDEKVKQLLRETGKALYDVQ